MSLVRAAHAAFALSLAVAVGAQNTWVPLQIDPTLRYGVTGSPLPPTVLTVVPPPFPLATVQTFDGGAFREHVDVLPAEFYDAKAAVYDAAHERIVVYCASPTASSVCVFDGARWSTLVTVNAPPPRTETAMAFDAASGAVVLFGGVQGSTYFGDTWRLDGNVWTQVGTPVAPSLRSGAALAAAALPSGGGLLLFGGQTGSTLRGDTWAWDGLAWTQLAPATSPPPRAAAASEFDVASGQTLLYGGADSAWRTDVWAWTGADWVALPSPSPNALPGAVLLRDGARTVLFGRRENFGPVEGYAWQGSWSPIFAEHSAPDAYSPGVAYDALRAETVRFGGRDVVTSAVRSDTWRWNGTWQEAPVAVHPPARLEMSMAFDPLRGEVVLFGGRNAVSVLGDTWVWNGTAWQQRVVAGGPPARRLATACWDPTRGTVVLHGGLDAVGNRTDTWEWDGTAWSQIASGPVEGGICSLAFDAPRSVLALYTQGKLWELQAGGWNLVNTNAPFQATLYFDPATGGLVAFGSSLFPTMDYLASTNSWQLRVQAVKSSIVLDSARNALISVSTGVYQSTATPATVAPYGAGCGPTGEVTYGWDRAPAFDAPATAWVRVGDPVSVTALFFGLTQVQVPIGGGCSVYADDLLFNLLVLTQPSGWASFDVTVPVVPGTLGLDVSTAAVTVSAGGLGFSNGVQLTLGF